MIWDMGDDLREEGDEELVFFLREEGDEEVIDGLELFLGEAREEESDSIILEGRVYKV